MKPFFRKKFKTLAIVLSLIFFVLFLFRLGYGYKTVSGFDTHTFLDSQIQFVSDESSPNIRKNYASKKYSAGQSQVRMDQKYEKIADIHVFSNQFDAEEKQVRKEVEHFDALIQFENKNGNKGHRKLDLVIGVPPENFDTLYQKLIGIGKVYAKQITKKDKTNEYKELNAKKMSLEKILESLRDLKSKGGRIDEYIQLENRILDIERQLQELGVSLGNFDEENEFCTVKFSLSETQLNKIGLLQRIKVALEWTIKNYLMLMAALSFMTLIAYLSVLILKNIKTKTDY